MERLQKLIAAAGVCSRRAAEELILAGRVKVNGKVVKELGTRAGADDRIEVDGEPLTQPKRHHYVLLNKPAGYVTTRHDPHQRETVYDLLFDSDQQLHPVGRLDRDTCGLLLLTDDGDLTNRLTHPRYGVEKVYHVVTKPWPKREHPKALRDGVQLEDGLGRAKTARIYKPDGFEIVMVEGRKREVRRMLEALGYEIQFLQRVRLGTLPLGDLREGHTRPLKADEVRSLRELVGLDEAVL